MTLLNIAIGISNFFKKILFYAKFRFKIRFSDGNQAFFMGKPIDFM